MATLVRVIIIYGTCDGSDEQKLSPNSFQEILFHLVDITYYIIPSQTRFKKIEEVLI